MHIIGGLYTEGNHAVSIAALQDKVCLTRMRIGVLGDDDPLPTMVRPYGIISATSRA